MRRRSSRPFFSRNWKIAVHHGASFRSGASATDIFDPPPNTYGCVYAQEAGAHCGAVYRRVGGQKILFEDTKLEVGGTYEIRIYPKLQPEVLGGWSDTPYLHEAKLLHVFERRSALEKYQCAEEWGVWLKAEEIQEGLVQILHFERLIVMVWRRESNWVRLKLNSSRAKRLLKQIREKETV